MAKMALHHWREAGVAYHANMISCLRDQQEQRFDAKGGGEVWRVTFAFDPERRAIVLTAGDKQGVSERLFYKRLIKKADERFDRHLAALSARKPKRN